jgi:hypothetical protein
MTEEGTEQQAQTGSFDQMIEAGTEAEYPPLSGGESAISPSAKWRKVGSDDVYIIGIVVNVGFGTGCPTPRVSSACACARGYP